MKSPLNLSVRALFTLTLLFSMAQAWADTNLLDLMKAGKHKFAIHQHCQTFVQQADHKTLKSDKITNLTTSLAGLGFNSDYFFHYSDDEGEHLKTAVKTQDFRDIQSFLLTYKDALGNIMGPGLYVAANPFSSLEYGKYQVILKINPKARVFNYLTQSKGYGEVINEFNKKYPHFTYCDGKTQFILIMDENDVDMVRYSNINATTEEWLVMLNEDVIQKTRYNLINQKNIMKSMVEQNNADALLGLLADISPHRHHKFPLQTLLDLFPKDDSHNDKILSLAKGITAWDDTTSKVFAGLVATQKGPALNKLMAHFSPDKFPLSTYHEIPLTTASHDFGVWILNRIEKYPWLLKEWKGDLFTTNIASLINLKLIWAHESDLITTAEQVNALFEKRKALGLVAGGENQIIIRYASSQHFKKLDVEAKYKVFNEFMHGGSFSLMQEFINALNTSGYDLAASHQYILKKPTAFKPEMAAGFIQSYIKLKGDPALLDKNTITFLVNQNVSTFRNFIKMIVADKKNWGTSGADLIMSALPVLSYSSLGHLVEDYASLFSNAEKDKIISLFLTGPSITAPQMKSYVQMLVNKFNLETSDLLGQVEQNFTKLTPIALIEIMPYLEEDSKLMATFTDLSKSKITIQILNKAEHEAVTLTLLSKYRPQLLKDISLVPSMTKAGFEAAYNPNGLASIMEDYNSADKWKTINLVMQFHPDQHLDFIDDMTFDKEMTGVVLKRLTQNNVSFKTYERLINNKQFVAQLSSKEFESTVAKLTSFKTDIDLKGLWASDLVDFNKSLVLFKYLAPVHDKYNLTYLKKEHLNLEKLTAAQRSTLLILYLDHYEKLSGNMQMHYWPGLVTYAAKNDMIKNILDRYDVISREKQDDVLSYYLTSAKLFNQGLKEFSEHDKEFIVEVLKSRNENLLAHLAPYLELNYPRMEIISYVKPFIDEYHLNKTVPEIANHMQSFICKKVNKYNAFSEVIGANKHERSRLKDMRKAVCR